MAVSYIGASNLIATNGGAPGAITPHANTQTGDLLVFFHYGRATGGNETVSAPGGQGWTQLFQSVTANNGHVAVFYKVRQAGDGTSTFTVTNYTSGTTGETILQWIETYRGQNTTTPIANVTASLSTWASSLNLGSISAPSSATVNDGDMVVVFAGRFENVTAQTTLTGDSLTWAQGTRNDSTLGSDAGAVTQQGLNSSGSDKTVTAKTITTTGTTQAGAGIMFVIEQQAATQWDKTNTDNLTLSDAATKSAGKAASDSISLSDSATKQSGKAAADTISLTDAATKQLSKTISDSISLTDSIAKAPAKFPEDAITLSDNLTSERQINQSLADNISLTDAAVKEVAISKQDSLALSDATAKESSKSASDSITLSDNLTSERQINKSLTDNISFTDAAVKEVAISRQDALTISDAPVKRISKPQADNISLSDTPQAILVKSLSDSVSFSDAAVKEVAISKQDALTLADAPVKQINKLRAEGLSLSDQFTYENTNTEPQEYTLSLSDNLRLRDRVTYGEGIYARVQQVSMLITRQANATDYTITRNAKEVPHTITPSNNGADHTISGTSRFVPHVISAS